MYSVTVEKNIDLGFEAAGNLVAQVLQEDFEFISKEINDLKNKRDLKSFEAEDYKNNLEVRDAMKIMLRYYLTHKKYVEFMELQRVYGNVE